MTATPAARSLARPGVPPRAGSRAGRGAPARRLPAHLGLSGTRRPASRINLVGPIDPTDRINLEIGRASCRERESYSVDAVSLKNCSKKAAKTASAQLAYTVI